MKIIRKLLGPKSKYMHTLPYVYEARVPTFDDYYKYFISDKVCQLILFLKKQNISPEETALFEIFQKKENEINIDLCTGKDGHWLTQGELCKAFRGVYPGHINHTCCSFRDRTDSVVGP